MRKTFSVIPLAAAISIATAVPAMAQQPDMNSYMLDAVQMLAQERGGHGYDISGSFTQDLQYAGECCVKATKPRRTMCVAAVTETIIEALNSYVARTGDTSVAQRLPISAFQKGNLLALRPYLFQFVQTDPDGKKRSVSRGIGHALELFGIGEQRSFDKLSPGDVVNFNRRTAKPSGHAVVFLGYIGKNGVLLPDYRADIAGFRYFSAQGKRDDGGLGYRNAYFDGYCPGLTSDGVRNDCKVIRSLNPAILNAGRLLAPSTWRVEQARVQIANRAAERVAASYGKTRDEAFGLEVKRVLSTELEPSDLSHMNADE